MYDELVKRLRDAAKMSEALAVLLPHSEGNATAKLYKEAADAIECLNSQIANEYIVHKAIHRNLSARIPRWIPTAERLPEEPYGCLAIVWDNPRYGDGDMFLNYYPEFVGWDGETWNDADGEEIPLDVVYWMKMPQIPEPPKEGE